MTTNKTLSMLALAGALLGTAPAHAQINLDFNTATFGKDANNGVQLSNITYQGKLYDVKLVWNPYDARFDVAGVAAVSGTARVCNLGEVTAGSLKANATLTVDAVARSITVGLRPATVLTVGYNTTFAFFFGNAWTIVQNGREVYTSRTSTGLGTTKAVIAIAPSSIDLDWITIPSGSLREAVITGIPTYMDLSAPLSKVLVNEKEYACK